MTRCSFTQLLITSEQLAVAVSHSLSQGSNEDTKKREGDRETEIEGRIFTTQTVARRVSCIPMSDPLLPGSRTLSGEKE